MIKSSAILVVGLLGLALAQQPAPPPDRTGEEVFGGVCARCHGEDGRGNTAKGKRLKVPDFHAERVQKLTLEQVIRVVSEGKDEMPSHATRLTPKQIRAVALYVLELRGK